MLRYATASATFSFAWATSTIIAATSPLWKLSGGASIKTAFACQPDFPGTIYLPVNGRAEMMFYGTSLSFFAVSDNGPVITYFDDFSGFLNPMPLGSCQQSLTFGPIPPGRHNLTLVVTDRNVDAYLLGARVVLIDGLDIMGQLISPTDPSETTTHRQDWPPLSSDSTGDSASQTDSTSSSGTSIGSTGNPHKTTTTTPVTPTPTSLNPTGSVPPSRMISKGIVAGAILGSLIVLMIASLAGFYVIRRRRTMLRTQADHLDGHVRAFPIHPDFPLRTREKPVVPSPRKFTVVDENARLRAALDDVRGRLRTAEGPVVRHGSETLPSYDALPHL